MNLKQAANFIFSVIMIVGLHQIAHAETKYKTTFVGKTDFQSIDWNGGKATAGTLKGVLETYGSNNAKAPNGHSIQNCVLKSVRVNDSTDIQANCTVTDKDGDAMFSTSERKQGDINAGTGGKGKTRYIGGTGKYKGINGSCEYQTRYMPDNWLSVESECVRND